MLIKKTITFEQITVKDINHTKTQQQCGQGRQQGNNSSDPLEKIRETIARF